MGMDRLNRLIRVARCEGTRAVSALNVLRLRIAHWILASFRGVPEGYCHYCLRPLRRGEIRHHPECWEDSL